MIISYLGVESFKVQFGDTVLALNPVSKESKLKSSKYGADIALVSLNDKDMNGVENAAHGERAPFVINGPGEYEVKGIFVKGYPSVSKYGKEDRINTIYSIAIEGMNICFLGAIGANDLSDDVKEAFETVDILITPIGGDGVLDPATSYKLAVDIEPKIIIPMHYGEVGDKNALKTFIKEAGAEKVSPIDKLTIKRKDLDGKEGEVVILSSQV